MPLDPRHHFTDTYHGLRDYTRRIANFARRLDPVSGEWLLTDPDVEDSEEVIDGEAFRYVDRRNPLISGVADGSTAAKTGLITLVDAARPDRWCKLKLLGVNAVSPIITRGERLTVFPGIVDFTTLVTQRGRGCFHKHLRLSQTGHPAEFRWMVIQPAGHTWAIVDNSLRLYDATGAEWLKTVPAGGRDSSGEFGKSIRVAMVQRPAIGNYGTFACRPVAADLAAAVYPVEIDDPTATISGTSAIEDVFINWKRAVANAVDYNYGGSVAILTGWGGTPPVDDIHRRSVIRVASSALPDGTHGALRLIMYRYSSAASAGAGAASFYVLKDAATWTEGTNAAESAQAGSVCWNQAQYGTPGVAWPGGANGCGVSGTDFDADASPPAWSYDAYTVGADVQITVALKAAWSQAWKNATRTNNGFVMKPSDSYVYGSMAYIRSTEYGSGNNPYFEIDYTTGSLPRLALSYWE